MACGHRVIGCPGCDSRNDAKRHRQQTDAWRIWPPVHRRGIVPPVQASHMQPAGDG
jgi:hypothetical protein